MRTCSSRRLPKLVTAQTPNAWKPAPGPASTSGISDEAVGGAQAHRVRDPFELDGSNLGEGG